MPTYASPQLVWTRQQGGYYRASLASAYSSCAEVANVYLHLIETEYKDDGSKLRPRSIIATNTGDTPYYIYIDNSPRVVPPRTHNAIAVPERAGVIQYPAAVQTDANPGGTPTCADPGLYVESREQNFSIDIADPSTTTFPPTNQVGIGDGVVYTASELPATPDYRWYTGTTAPGFTIGQDINTPIQVFANRDIRTLLRLYHNIQVRSGAGSVNLPVYYGYSQTSQPNLLTFATASLVSGLLPTASVWVRGDTSGMTAPAVLVTLGPFTFEAQDIYG